MRPPFVVLLLVEGGEEMLGEGAIAVILAL